MTINWNEIGQRLNSVLHNYAEFVDKYYQFFTGPAQDIPVEYYDINGNPRQANIPSVAKLRDRFINNVNSAMYKEIYVDAENGSDTNGDGSKSAPFKTIDKAVDSIPSGGLGRIRLRGEFIVSWIHIVNKHIIIAPWNEGFKIKPKIYSTTAGGTNYYEYIGFGIHDMGTLLFNLENNDDTHSIIEIPDIPDDKSITPYSGLIVLYENTGFGSVYFYLRTRVDNRQPIKVGSRAVLVSVLEWSYNRPTHFAVNISGHYDGTNRHIMVHSNGNLINVKGSPASIYIDYNGGFKDENGNAIDPKSKIKGIIKDSNGRPLNVISNLAF